MPSFSFFLNTKNKIMKSMEQPQSEDKKKFIENEDKLAAIKAKPVEDLTMEEFKALQVAKAENAALVDKAQEEAGAEDAERKIYDEAKAEDAERKMFDEAKAEDAAFEQKKAAESALQLAEDARVKAAEDAEAAAKVLEGIQGAKTETGQLDGVGENPEQTKENSNEDLNRFQKYIDEIMAHPGYEGTRLTFMPEEVKADEAFLLKVAEVNPSAAFSHASKELQHNKKFILKLMKAQPNEKADKVNYHRVDFYDIERKTPELMGDKDLAMAVIQTGSYETIPAKMLNDKDVHEAITQREILKLSKEAQEFARDKKNGYAHIANFKLRDDGQTVGGERWSLSNDAVFVAELKRAVSKYVDVSIRKGELYFSSKDKQAA